MGAAAAAFLAACAGKQTPVAAPNTLPPLAHQLTVAQWPLYIDRAKGGHRPTLEAFQSKYDIDVTYREIINDNQDFFAKLVPLFQANQPTGWDLITLSDWVVTRMNRGGWVEELHHDRLPNVEANLLPAFKDPIYDPGNAHSVPWQGGITGIAYNPKLTGFELKRFADLWDHGLAGHVGMLTEMVDTMTLTLLMLGVDPQKATINDAARARADAWDASINTLPEHQTIFAPAAYWARGGGNMRVSQIARRCGFDSCSGCHPVSVERRPRAAPNESGCQPVRARRSPRPEGRV